VAAVAAAAGKLKPQKALYQHKSRSGTGATPARGSGLDELAQIVSSSGLSGSGLTRGGLRTGPGGKKVVTTPVESTGAHNKKRLMLVGGAVALVLLTVVIVLSLTGGSDAPPGPVSLETGCLVGRWYFVRLRRSEQHPLWAGSGQDRDSNSRLHGNGCAFGRQITGCFAGAEQNQRGYTRRCKTEQTSPEGSRCTSESGSLRKRAG